MIKIEKKVLNVGKYPDGTPSIEELDEKFLSSLSEIVTVNNRLNITWKYDYDMSELFVLECVVDKLRELYGDNLELTLKMAYVPNARMDRIKKRGQFFTLKTFAKAINRMGFRWVTVKNVHSDVSKALINHIYNDDCNEEIGTVISEYKPDALFLPDEGAKKRYCELKSVIDANLPVGMGYKERAFGTANSQITSFEVLGYTDFKDKKVLIIDDICSKGTSFYYSAKKLKELGARDVALYITHCEDNIENGELLKGDEISKIYTTDSICRIKNDKIVNAVDLLF